MKKRLSLIAAIALVVAAVAALLFWLLRGKELCDYIPARSKAVVRFSPAADQAATDGFAATMRRITGVTPRGIDASQERFFFITPNGYIAFAARLNDAEALAASLPHERRNEEEGREWCRTSGGWTFCWTDAVLLVAGPGSEQENAELRHTLIVLSEAPADEGFGHTERYAQLATESDAAATMTATCDALPLPYGLLLRAALPVGCAPDMVTFNAALSATEHGFIARGTLSSTDQNTQRLMAEADRTARYIKRVLPDGLSEGAAFCLVGNGKGADLAQLLKSDLSTRPVLTALADSANAEKRMAEADGNFSLIVTEMGENRAQTACRFFAERNDGTTFTLASTHEGGTTVPFRSRPVAEVALGLRLYCYINPLQLLSKDADGRADNIPFAELLKSLGGITLKTREKYSIELNVDLTD